MLIFLLAMLAFAPAPQLRMPLSAARLECKALQSAITSCRLLVDQTTTRYRYRVELSTMTIFGSRITESFEGADWAEALALAKAKARPPIK